MSNPTAIDRSPRDLISFGQSAQQRCPKHKRDYDYIEFPELLPHWRDGCFAVWPLFFPGKPLIFDGSCCWILGSCWFGAVEPIVPRVGLTAGPLLVPG